MRHGRVPVPPVRADRDRVGLVHLVAPSLGRNAAHDRAVRRVHAKHLVGEARRHVQSTVGAGVRVSGTVGLRGVVRTPGDQRAEDGDRRPGPAPQNVG